MRRWVKRSCLAVGCLGALIIVAVCVLVAGFTSRSARLDTATLEAAGDQGRALTTAEMEAAVNALIADHERWARRQRIESRFGWFLPDAVVYALAPDDHAMPRLVRERAAVLAPLLATVQDRKAHPWVREYAWFVLSAYDDPGILAALFGAHGTDMAPANEQLILTSLLPVYPDAASAWTDADIAGLDQKLRTDGYGELCLSLLDTHLQRPDRQPWDYVALRWLNRYYAVDVDEWLGANCPEALALRNTELARGYDVLLAANPGRAGTTYWVTDDDARALWSDEASRRGFDFLGRCLGPAGTGPRPASAGWRAALLKWYQENRSRLVYDADERRFAVTR